MPRMMTTSRLAVLLLGLSLLLSRCTMASPLITHRLSTEQNDAMTAGSESDSSRASSRAGNTTKTATPPLSVTPAESAAPSTISPGISQPSPQSSVLSEPDSRALNSEQGSSLPETGPLGSSETRAAVNAAPPAQNVGGGRASIPAGGVNPPAGAVAPRVMDGLSRVESNRGSTVQTLASPVVSVPAQQPAQPSSDAAAAPRPASSSTGKSISDSNAAPLSSNQPVPLAPSLASSTPAAQMLAGPAPVPVPSGGSLSSSATTPAATGNLTPPAGGSSPASSSTAPSGSTASGPNMISSSGVTGALPTSASSLPPSTSAGTNSPQSSGMTNPSPTARLDPSSVGGTVPQAGVIVDGSMPAGSLTANSLGTSLSAGHPTPSSLVSLASSPQTSLINAGAGGGTTSDPVSTMSAINALSNTPSPLSPGSVSSSVTTGLPLPMVQVTDDVTSPSALADGRSDPLVGPLPASVPEPSVLEMLGLLALGFGSRCMFRLAARLWPRSHRPRSVFCVPAPP